MKTNRINPLARLTGLTIAIALFAGITGATSQEIGSAKGGAAKLLTVPGKQLTSKSSPGDDKAMACAKCRDEVVRRVDWTARGANKPTVTVARHLCDGCGNDWVVSGHGKAKTSTAVHKCASCGAESLACCSTSKTGINASKAVK